MHVDEREWLRAQQPDNVALHAETSDHARAELRAHMMNGARPAGRARGPLTAAEWRALRWPQRRRFARATKFAAGLASIGAMGVAVAVVASGPGSAGDSVFAAVRGGHDHGLNLMRVADRIRNMDETVGNATLVIRSQTYPGKAPIVGADLYTDSGQYFFAHDKSGLGAQIIARNNQADGLFAREIAAAKHAATATNMDAARAQMADAPDPSDPVPPGTIDVPAGPKGPGGPVSRFDNYLWGDSLDALQAGAGNPHVRAGVLRLLASMNDVTVTQTTTKGQSTLKLVASGPVFGVDGYQEEMMINAQTGIPVAFLGGDPSKPDVTVTYNVSRVSTRELTHGN
jgi:hypothetical protein